MALTDPSKRLEAMPPYMFAELERRIAEKREAGIEVISLGIGDPDQPTYPHIVKAMQAAVAENANQKYPSNRGRAEFRGALSSFYGERFGVEIDPETEVIPAIGAKECIYNLCFAFLDPGDVALAADPGYPVYTGGPILAGATVEPLPLLPDLGFTPDLTAVAPEMASRARLMFLNYPNNPTGAVVPEGFFELVVSFAREHEILVVHDNAYSETTYDGYVAPSFLATPGAREVGVEVFSLSKGFNMTGWRCAAILGNAEAISTYWRLKTNVDSGLFDAIQLAGAAALLGPAGPLERMNETYARRRDLVVGMLRDIGVEAEAPRGTIYVWAPVPPGHTSTSFAELVLEEAAVVVSPGSMYGAGGEGFFRISLTTPDEAIAEAVDRMQGAPGSHLTRRPGRRVLSSMGATLPASSQAAGEESSRPAPPVAGAARASARPRFAGTAGAPGRASLADDSAAGGMDGRTHCRAPAVERRQWWVPFRDRTRRPGRWSLADPVG